MMSAVDFDLKYRHIEEQFDAKDGAAKSYRDQELARLYVSAKDSGRTQEWLAERVSALTGKAIGQAYLSRRLVFGRFLNFMPSGINANGLTEGRFRELMKGTTGKEQARFERVLELLAEGAGSAPAKAEHGALKAAIIAAMDDGQWYFTNQIAATVEETLPHVTPAPRPQPGAWRAPR